MNKIWLFTVAVVVVAALLVTVSFFGSSESVADDAQVPYLCAETNQLVRAPAQPTPALNPITGRKTLLRALYCPQCGKWQAVPPSDLFHANPLSFRCPKHRCDMTPDGPPDEKPEQP